MEKALKCMDLNGFVYEYGKYSYHMGFLEGSKAMKSLMDSGKTLDQAFAACQTHKFLDLETQEVESEEPEMP